MQMMAQPSLTGLPEELRLNIYRYLDFDDHSDPRDSPRYINQDKRNLSSTCKQLYTALFPDLFQTVTIRLRWENGLLVEPGIIRLQQERPDLACLVRRVYIRTDLGRAECDSPVLAVPDDSQGWSKIVSPAHIAPTLVDARKRNIKQVYRTQCAKAGRIILATETLDNAVQAVFSQTALTRQHQDGFRMCLEGRVRQYLHQEAERKRQGLDISWRSASCRKICPSSHLSQRTLPAHEDSVLVSSFAKRAFRYMKCKCGKLYTHQTALAVAILCIPITTTSLVLDLDPALSIRAQDFDFAVWTASAALSICAGQLSALTKMTYECLRRNNYRCEHSYILTDVPPDFQNLTHLTLVQPTRAYRPREPHCHKPWQVLGARLTYLRLFDHYTEWPELVSFVQMFKVLQNLELERYKLRPQPRTTDLHPERLRPWLSVMIALRRSNPDLQISLLDISMGGKVVEFPPAWSQWLVESLPPGRAVEEAEECRLHEEWQRFASEVPV